MAAWFLRIPLVVVEPNSYAGLANRVLGRFAKKVFVCFPGKDRQGFFPASKKVLTGPLVRKGLDQGNRDRALAEFGLEPGRFTVLAMGGSGGAHAINMAMKEAAKELKDIPDLQVLHQTGDKDASDVTDGYRRYEDVSYPCFTTPGGRRVELREGIWTGTSHGAPSPLTAAAGSWSPSTIMTKSRSARSRR
jgi:UDP-N-acetylglucosamine:LPS N-acetylglucosamine transferase